MDLEILRRLNAFSALEEVLASRIEICVNGVQNPRKSAGRTATASNYLMFQLHPDITSAEFFCKLKEKFSEQFVGGEVYTGHRRL